MKFFSKNDIKADFKAECPLCGELATTNLSPEERVKRGWECENCYQKMISKNLTDLKTPTIPKQPVERGSKEISVYDPEYEWLMKLIKVISKAAPESVRDIKELSLKYPFVTVDDIGDLTAKIWTLAVEKYHIPREWLIKKLPEKKIKSDLRDDEWPAQRAAEDFGMRPWNETAYESWKNTEASEEKKASPETDHALFMSMGEDIIKEYFFEKGIRWSQVVQFIKDQAPQLTDEDVANLKTDTQYKLEQYKIQVDSKKKGLSLDKVLQILEQKGPKPVHVDHTDLTIELEDGTKLTFDSAVQKALELSKNSSADSEEQERNKDSGTGFYDSPNGYQFGKRPQGDPSEWPSNTWMPRGTETEDQEPWDNIAASLNRPFSKKESNLNKKAYWWGSSSGRIEFEMTPDQVASVNGQGQHDEDARLLVKELRPQLDKIDPKLLASELKEYGAWDDTELADHEENLQRLVWIAGNDISEHEFEQENREVDIDIQELPTLDKKQRINELLDHLSVETDPQKKEQIKQHINRIKMASLNKVANPPSRFWIAPDGKEFNAGTNHGGWIKINKDLLHQQGINTSTVGYSWDDMINKGWVRVSNEPAGTGFQIQVKDLKHLPSFLDDFISRNFTEGNVIEMGDQNSNLARVYDPFPSIQKAVNRSLSIRQPVNAMLKRKADISGKVVNDILALIQQNGGATYNLQQGNLVGQEAFAISIYPDKEKIVPEVDYDTLEGYIIENEELLNDLNNSFGAWASGGKVFLDIVATIPNKEEALELARKNNQLAIWDLCNNQEISTGVQRTIAFSKKELVKKAEEQILPQNIQDEVASKWGPAMNILLSNYAQAVKNGHDQLRAIKYAFESIQNLDTNISLEQAEDAASTYLKGLV